MVFIDTSIFLGGIVINIFDLNLDVFSRPDKFQSLFDGNSERAKAPAPAKCFFNSIMRSVIGTAFRMNFLHKPFD